MKKGTKRLLCVLMLCSSPLVSAAPISTLQGTIPRPKLRVTVISPEIIPAVIKPKIRNVRLERGTASWYSETDPYINIHTANGEVFDDSKLTCASWDHAFGTRLEVTNLKNGKSVVCRVNDRGPNKRLKRLVDLSKAAFREIAPLKSGLIKVSVKKLSA